MSEISKCPILVADSDLNWGHRIHWTIIKDNIGPLISLWELNKFKNCWNKTFRTCKMLTFLYEQFSNLLILRDMSCPRLGTLSNNRWSGDSWCDIFQEWFFSSETCDNSEKQSSNIHFSTLREKTWLRIVRHVFLQHVYSHVQNLTRSSQHDLHTVEWNFSLG
jgi:hypothetical protein